MTAEVHLHLRGDGTDEVLPALRQSLADCLASGVAQVRVHVEDGDDVELDVLRSLQAAAQVLEGRGGALLLLGAGEQVRRRAAVHGLQGLLPVLDPYPDAALRHDEDAHRADR